MLEKINTQINHIKEEVVKKHILENKLQQLEIELQKSREEVEQLEKNVEKEKKDVDNLNKTSISSLISTVLGNKEEKTQKEQQEYINAKTKYENSKANEELIYSQIIDIETRLRAISNYEKQYEELLKQKRKLINTYKDMKTIDEIISIEQVIDKCIKDIKEIEESIIIGDKLLHEINKSKDLLNSARNWGAVDMLGGGMLSSINKHDRFNDAQRNFLKITNLAKHFNKELKNIELQSVEFSNTSKNLDIYFEIDINEIEVGIEILKAHKNISNLKKDVENIVANLKVNEQNLHKLLSVKRNEYDVIIKNMK